ncbi:hypothetical protein F8M41_015516 [Gigaspora margarita]|uniref:Uncharacterized protein n=1 Tax=Gigaspora margarita TaxID=4874 RepID=A0A8H3WVI0_GIGMA|nr:hypothetical protein F8M41_015516 [Gigaspora margarita]
MLIDEIEHKNTRIEELREENVMLVNEVQNKSASIEVLTGEIQKKDARIEELENENVILTNGIEELKAKDSINPMFMDNESITFDMDLVVRRL